MPVLTFALETLYSADELEAVIEQSIFDAANILTGRDIHMLDAVAKLFPDSVAFKELLGKIQDLLRRDHGISVRLTNAKPKEVSGLIKGVYLDLSMWIYRRLEKRALSVADEAAGEGQG